MGVGRFEPQTQVCDFRWDSPLAGTEEAGAALDLDGYRLTCYFEILGEVNEEIFSVIVAGVHFLNDAFMSLQESPSCIDCCPLGLLGAPMRFLVGRLGESLSAAIDG